MSSGSCRSCSCSHNHAHDHSTPARTPGLGWIKALAGLALVGVIAASTIAMVTQPPTPSAPPSPPAAPAKPAQAQPSASPASVDPAPAAGTIRHGLSEPIAKKPGTLRVASYNLENLFAAAPAGTKTDPQSDAKEGDRDAQPADPKPDAHLKALAEAIRRVNADVLACDEVESLTTLTSFRDKYLADMGYQYIVSLDSGDTRGIEQSVLSRYPLKDARVWPGLPLGGTHPEKWGRDANHEAGKPITYRRSPLRVTVEVPPPSGSPPDAKPYTLTLFAVHYKSGSPGGYWREREAAKTIELVREVETENPAANVVILGDFNARPQEKPVRLFIDAGFTDAFGDLNLKDPKYITHASDRVIDHIILNRNAAPELVKDTRFVLGTPQRASNADWRNTPPPPGYASDHYPIVIDLLTTDQPVPQPAPATSPAGAAPTAPPQPSAPPAKPAPRP